MFYVDMNIFERFILFNIYISIFLVDIRIVDFSKIIKLL